MDLATAIQYIKMYGTQEIKEESDEDFKVVKVDGFCEDFRRLLRKHLKSPAFAEPNEMRVPPANVYHVRTLMRNLIPLLTIIEAQQVVLRELLNQLPDLEREGPR